jgi:hypothetical protein
MLRRMLIPMPLNETAKVQPPWCDDCHLPAAFRTEVSHVRLDRRIRVYQCTNCARVIWDD